MGTWVAFSKQEQETNRYPLVKQDMFANVVIQDMIDDGQGYVAVAVARWIQENLPQAMQDEIQLPRGGFPPIE